MAPPQGLNFFIVIYREMLKKNLLLKNHCPECIDVWYGSSLGQGDLNLFK